MNQLPVFEPDALFLLSIGFILLSGLIISTVGRQTFLPRVTLLLIFGVMIGKDGLDIVPSIISDKFELVTDMALLMIGFLLGGKLTKESLGSILQSAFWISVSAAVLTTIVVSLGLLLLNIPIPLAIMLGCLAAATDPAAILDVIEESGYEGRFKNLLISIVALDDAWALILFGIGVAVVSSLTHGVTDSSALIVVLKDIGGAVMLGLCIGFPAAYFTGRLKPGQPILTEALGIVFVCGGLALWLDVSFLIAAMVLGAVVANFATHHEYPFHAIEGIEWPFMVIFFVLAGAELDLSMLAKIGVIGFAYLLLRSFGKVIGGTLGGGYSGVDKSVKKWMGVALLPQAGVAIGMALVAANYFPEHRQLLLSVAISSTVIFEIIGPVFTRISLTKMNHQGYQKNQQHY
ncbi:cation:proton antiporter [Aliikangiella maris]|uniref:Cation:proton antiporter n=2 Tax=Aliikangiella maris TaxID=3162458 RepID=A0ABV2BUU0_9GAMM